MVRNRENIGLRMRCCTVEDAEERVHQYLRDAIATKSWSTPQDGFATVRRGPLVHRSGKAPFDGVHCRVGGAPTPYSVSEASSYTCPKIQRKTDGKDGTQ